MRHAFTVLVYYPKMDMLMADATFIEDARRAANHARKLAYEFAGSAGNVEIYESDGGRNNAYIAKNVHGEERYFYLVYSAIY